jgi:RHS repeat-associated protein
MPVETFEDFVTGNNVLTRNFVGGQGLEAISTTQNTLKNTAYPVYDTHGNMTATLSLTGNGTGWNFANERSFEVWGSVRSGAAAGGPKGRYVANLGHVQDDESGLIYMRARYYEPESGRFVSEDKANDGSNWYVYALNSPAAFNDTDWNTAAATMLCLLGKFFAWLSLSNHNKGVRMEEFEKSLLGIGKTIKHLAKSATSFNTTTLCAALSMACYGLALNSPGDSFKGKDILKYTAVALGVFGSVLRAMGSYGTFGVTASGAVSIIVMATYVYTCMICDSLLSMEFD